MANKDKVPYEHVLWTPGRVVRGLSLYCPSDDSPYGVTVNVRDGAFQEFLSPPSLTRKLEPVQDASLLIITCLRLTPTPEFKVDWQRYGVWEKITRTRLTLRRDRDGSIKTFTRPAVKDSIVT